MHLRQMRYKEIVREEREREKEVRLNSENKITYNVQNESNLFCLRSLRALQLMQLFAHKVKLSFFFCLNSINGRRHVRLKLINFHRYLLLDDINFQAKAMRVNAGRLRYWNAVSRDARVAIFHVKSLLPCGSSN